MIKQRKSKNSYIVTINNKDKHVSADHITFISKGCSNVNGKESDRNLNSNLDSNKDPSKSNHSDDNLDFSDNESDVSDIDIYLPQINHSMPISDSNNGNLVEGDNANLVAGNITGSFPKRKYKAEHLKLRDGLSTTFPVSRTRSGRV